jgi:hypothetical protein
VSPLESRCHPRKSAKYQIGPEQRPRSLRSSDPADEHFFQLRSGRQRFAGDTEQSVLVRPWIYLGGELQDLQLLLSVGVQLSEVPSDPFQFICPVNTRNRDGTVEQDWLGGDEWQQSYSEEVVRAVKGYRCGYRFRRV